MAGYKDCTGPATLRRIRYKNLIIPATYDPLRSAHNLRPHWFCVPPLHRGHGRLMRLPLGLLLLEEYHCLCPRVNRFRKFQSVCFSAEWKFTWAARSHEWFCAYKYWYIWLNLVKDLFSMKHTTEWWGFGVGKCSTSAHFSPRKLPVLTRRTWQLLNVKLP